MGHQIMKPLNVYTSEKGGWNSHLSHCTLLNWVILPYNVKPLIHSLHNVCQYSVTRDRSSEKSQEQVKTKAASPWLSITWEVPKMIGGCVLTCSTHNSIVQEGKNKMKILFS